MIEQALRFGAILRLASNAESLGNCLVDQLLLGCFGKHHLERFIDDRAFDLFELEVAFETTAPDRFLFDFVGRVTESETLVVEVAIFTQARDHSLNDFFVRVLAAEQTLAQLGHRAGPRCQQFYSALKCFTSQISHNKVNTD